MLLCGYLDTIDKMIKHITSYAISHEYDYHQISEPVHCVLVTVNRKF